MTYKATQFGGTAIATGTYITLAGIESQNIGANRALSGLIAVPGGGGYDAFGVAVAPLGPGEYSIPLRITAATAALVETAVDALRAWVGKSDKLWARDAAMTASRWRQARLLEISLDATPHARAWITGSLMFELQTTGWKGTAIDTGGIPLDTNPHNVSPVNGGNKADDEPIINFIAGASDVTVVTFVVSGVTSITWTGTLLGTKTLGIDCGARSVLNDGADARSGLTLNAAHTISPWLRLAASATTTVAVSWTGGGLPTCFISGYDGWY